MTKRCAPVLCTVFVAAQILNASAGTWTPLVNQAPDGIGTMLLLSDGTVLGHNGGSSWYKLRPDSSGSYVNGTWSTVAAMHDSRLYYSSVVLRDGRLFVAGGEYGTGGATAEIYDATADTWAQLASAPGVSSFADSICKLLPDGRVLVAPVYIGNYGTVIYDPVANTWTSGPLCLGSQDEVSWVKLPDDSILTIDSSRPPSGNAISCERYIPSSNQWINDATIPVPLYSGGELGAGLLLPNGKAFFIGANGNTAIYTPSGNNNPGTWVAGPTTPGLAGAPDAPAAAMVNGKVLCTLVPPGSTNYCVFCEYDPVANSFSSINSPEGATTYPYLTYYTRMLDLPDGTVLYTRSGTQLYVYNPGGTPLAAGKPSISGLTRNSNGSFHLVGTMFNGLCEGAAYGDDAQMDSNFPLVRLTDAAGNVFYAKTYNWSSTSVMTGTKPVSTDFMVPQEVPAGTYNLTVIANGNSSDPLSFLSGAIRLTPGTNFVWSGAVGGPFSASSQVFNLTNVGTSALNWSVINTSLWLTVTPASGSLTPGGSATSVTASLNFSASNLVAGSYSTVLVFSNLTDGTWQTRKFTLGVATADQPLAFTGQNAGLVVPSNATGNNTATYVTDSFGGWGFYAAGLNAVNYTGGSSTNEGLPASGQFTSAYDGLTRFQLGAYGTPTNVLLMSPHQGVPVSGTITLNSPMPLKSLSILASSGNGYSSTGGMGYVVLRFSDGNTSDGILYNAQDWFAPNGNVAITHFGRIYLGYYSAFFADNPSGNQPNLYHTKIDLAALGLATKTVTSLTFTQPPDMQNQSEDTAVFAISGTATGIGPAPTFLPATRTGSTITLSWTSVPGLRYVLQYKTNLSQATWADFALATVATNTIMSATDAASGDRARFYRAVFLP